MKGYITDYEDLRTWFEQTDETKWNLYSGFIDKFNNVHMLAKQENGDLEKEESFDLLKKMIGMNSNHGGQFTIYVTGPGNRGFITRMRIPAMATPGVGGYPAMGGNPYGMGMISIHEMEEKRRTDRMIWELEQKVNDLEGERESSVGALGQFFNRVTQDLDINKILNMAMVMLSSRMNVNPELMKAVQLSGMPEQHPQQPDDGTGYTYDDPRLLEFLDSIRSKFPDDESFYGFLARVGEFFQQNTAMAMQFFTSKG